MSSGYPGTRGQEQSNMVGQKFGRLLALNYNVKVSKQKRCDCYSCQCDCSIERVVSGNFLRKGNTRSCGCLQRETVSKMNVLRTGENSSQYVHGFCTEHRIFRKIVRERDKVCQRCGKTKEENGEKLSAHHLDGDEYNNDPENGSLLCVECHGIVTRGGNAWRSYERL